MAKNNTTIQGTIGNIQTKPMAEGAGLSVKVTFSFAAKGKGRQALLDLMGLQEQNVEIAVTALQGELEL